MHGKAASKNIEEWLGPKRINHFKIVLKAVRFWAHRRGIYSNNMGYLSGITLAVMVGRVCQDFPDLYPSCLLYKFFDRYAESNWREPVQMRNANQNNKNFKSL